MDQQNDRAEIGGSVGSSLITDGKVSLRDGKGLGGTAVPVIHLAAKLTCKWRSALVRLGHDLC